ncbi:MAG: YihY/virulence factor BrkB family protein [Solirubrobacteraceae bacterium]
MDDQNARARPQSATEELNRLVRERRREDGSPPAPPPRPPREPRPPHSRGGSRGRGERPVGLRHLKGGDWRRALRQTIKETREDNLTDWAAALTYYGVLALFPALIALVSILGLIGQSATGPLLDNLRTLTPGPATTILTSAIKQISASGGSAGIAFVFGLGFALFSASGYVGAFSRAANAIYEIEEGRPFWKLRPQQVLITAVMLVLLAASSIAVVLTGGLARRAGDLLGVGSGAVNVWDVAKWPVIVVLVTLMLSVLYYAAPNVRHPGYRWINPGSLLAVLLWVVVSAGFAFYVANFGSYNKTYGALASVVVFLVWLWLSNLAFLFGAEFNAELERLRAIELGMPPGQEPFLPAREAKAA